MSIILNNLRYEAFKPRPYIGMLLNQELPKLTIVPNRTQYYNNRHRDPKYRLERTRKLWKVELPDFDQMRDDEKKMTPEEMRSQLKEKGIAPPRVWDEREVFSPCTIAVIDAYKAESDGKSSSLIDKLKSPLSSGKELIKSRRELSAIRSFEGEDFDLKTFAKQSLDVYIKAHQMLASKKDEEIFDYVTEHCFPLMTAGLNRHTIIWKYIGEVEPAEVVQVRNGDMASKGNKYSQITVKLHTKQILAVYDRHGRLVHGSPNDVKEVLEYVVFEKYLANEYGAWRVHDRIRPADSSQGFSQQISKTYVDRSS